MSGQSVKQVSPAAGARVSDEMENPADEPSPKNWREELPWRSRQIESEGVGRFCACDASNDAIITTLYDTGLSAMGLTAEEPPVGGTVDNTYGSPTCNESVIMRHNERFHSEAAIPASYSFFQEDGTVIRYVHDFVVLSPAGEKMVPLDQLGRQYTTMWLLGKLKPVSKVLESTDLLVTMHPALYETALPRDASKNKSARKSKIVSVRAQIVDFFIDNGCLVSDVPSVFAVSEHDIYYRLDKVGVRYMTQFASFQSLYDMSTRITKEFQCNRNRRLPSILDEMSSDEDAKSTTWGDPMQISGFTNTMADKAMDFIYTECLYQHIFQHRYNSPLGPYKPSKRIEDKDSSLSTNGSLDEAGIIKQEFPNDGTLNQDYLATGEINTMVDDPASVLHDGSEINENMLLDKGAFEDTTGIGMLLCDVLRGLRNHRPFFFFDESFVVPEYVTGGELTEKHIDKFTIKEAAQPVVKKPKKTVSVKREPVHRPQPQPLPPPEPVEIKSKVSGRVIKRNSKLADSEDLLIRQPVEEPKPIQRRPAPQPVPDDALQRKYQMLVDVEKQCNALTLPEDFDYTSYNTASEPSGDEAGDQPFILLNDFQVELKDARYYPRDIPLRLLKFYGVDDMLDLSFVCRQFSVNPSGVEPLLPRFSLRELEQNVLYTTSVDLLRPLEPSTYRFQQPKCLCDFLSSRKEWFNTLGNAYQKVDGLFVGLLRHLVDYSRVEGFEYHLKLINESFDLSDKKKEVQTREIKAGIVDTETLDHFLTTHGGCLYRGRFRHISQDSEVQIPYVNALRWNKRFKRVERLLSATRLHRYTPINYEYQEDGIIITLDSRLSGVPIDILTNNRRRQLEYRMIYPQDVFEVLPTYSKKLQVWQEETVPETQEPSGLVESLNARLNEYLLGIFEVEKVAPFQQQAVLGFGFKETPELLNINIALQPSMLTEFTWPYMLRLYLFYAFYTCRRKYSFKLNSLRLGDAPVMGMSSIDEEDEEGDEEEDEEDVKEEDNQDVGDVSDVEENTQTITGDTAATPATHSDDEEEEEEEDEEEGEEGAKMGRRRGWGINRYSPYYDFELEWYPDPVRVNHLFRSSISPEAVKVIMEKLRNSSFHELDLKDRMVLLRWLGEVLTFHPNAKKFVDMRNDEFYYYKGILTKSDNSQTSLVTPSSDTQGSDTDKLTEGDNVIPLGGAEMLADNDQDTTPNVSQSIQTGGQGSQFGDVIKKKKPKEILREIAELEERYLQRNPHLGRDRFYNDYYYFGPELGCRIYVRTLPMHRFTAQRASVRTKHLRIPSFGAEKFKFDLSKYAKRLEEEHIFGTESKRGRHKKNASNENGGTDSKQPHGVGSGGENGITQSQVSTGSPDNLSLIREEVVVQMVKRRKQKGRKPKMVKPRLRRSRDFFERQPTNFENVTEYLNYLSNIPPRQCWGMMDSPKEVRMFIDRLSPLTINERNLQARLAQLEPELNLLAEFPQPTVECWRAPTPYGQLLMALTRGVWSYARRLYDMADAMLLRYDRLKAKDMPNSREEIRLCNMRLMRFVHESAKKTLASCCSDFDTTAAAMISLIEVVVLCEFVVARYCDWVHWSAVRPMWHHEIDSLYRDLQMTMMMNKEDRVTGPSQRHGGAASGSRCLCASRNSGMVLTSNEKTLLHAVEELGLWFRYMQVFHKERMELFVQYRMSVDSLSNIQQQSKLCYYVEGLQQGTLVYLFGGYRAWLMSLREFGEFPRELLTEMLSEFGTMPAGVNETSLIKMAEFLEPCVPAETLEAHVESVWFLDVPNYGPVVRMALSSVPYGPLDPGAEPLTSCEEGRLVQYLQTITADHTSQYRKSPTEDDPDPVVLRTEEASHESQRFIVYAPLDLQRAQAEFIFPFAFFAQHMRHLWQTSSTCLFRGRRASVIDVNYAAADLWQAVQIEVDESQEMVNLWEVSPL